VTTLAQRLNAANQARRTIGVRSVSDGMRVVPAQKVGDDEIARSARASISGSLAEAEAQTISVGVRAGVVTLSGFATCCYPKQIAATLVSVIQGVVDLRNEIVVRPQKRRSDADILAGVRARFAKNPMIPADRIKATVFDGIVVLTGTVSSFLQADQAESAACFVPGVIEVRNQLFVSGE
jgi:osmotically-inducible protein OsmY